MTSKILSDHQLTTSAASSSSSTWCTSCAFLALWLWWLRKKSWQWKKFRRIDKQLLLWNEAWRFHVVSQLHRHWIVTKRPKDFIDLADLWHVFEVDGCIEVRNIFDFRLQYKIVLACEIEISEWDNTCRWTWSYKFIIRSFSQSNGKK